MTIYTKYRVVRPFNYYYYFLETHLHLHKYLHIYSLISLFLKLFCCLISSPFNDQSSSKKVCVDINHEIICKFENTLLRLSRHVSVVQI